MGMAAIEHVLRRDRIVVVTALAVLTVLAWAYTLWAARTMEMGEMSMSGMGANMGMALAPAFRPWTGVDFLVMFVMWAVMMVGMMLPSAAPMILIYTQVARQATTLGKTFVSAGWFTTCSPNPANANRSAMRGHASSRIPEFRFFCALRSRKGPTSDGSWFSLLVVPR